jgi:hypothetical protein
MGALMSWVRDGCGHLHTSFPMTRSDKESKISEVGPVKTYVVCLNCGKEMLYSWEKMRVVRPAQK